MLRHEPQQDGAQHGRRAADDPHGVVAAEGTAVSVTEAFGFASAMPKTAEATAPPTVLTEFVSPVATPVWSNGAADAAAAGKAATSARRRGCLRPEA